MNEESQMSYQPYPTGGNQGGYPMAQRPPRPTSVQRAVWCMYGGAALSAISALIILVLSSRIRKAVQKAAVKANVTAAAKGQKTLTAAQIHSLATATVAILVIVLVIGIALWIWMAWANGKGKNWARIVASVLFAFNTLYLLLSVSRAGASVIFVGLGWLFGLGAIVMLWNRQSTPYFKPGTM
jgi:hypothetical protein